MAGIIIVPKIQGVDLYYLFRNNGQEVIIDTRGHYPKTSHKLTAEELTFINDNII
jgi:hypothetical protein